MPRSRQKSSTRRDRASRYRDSRSRAPARSSTSRVSASKPRSAERDIIGRGLGQPHEHLGLADAAHGRARAEAREQDQRRLGRPPPSGDRVAHRAAGGGCRPWACPPARGPKRPAATSASITAIAPFFRLTARGKAWIAPVAGSSKANSSPISRQPRSPSKAASVDLPAPEIRRSSRSARPSRSTVGGVEQQIASAGPAPFAGSSPFRPRAALGRAAAARRRAGHSRRRSSTDGPHEAPPGLFAAHSRTVKSAQAVRGRGIAGVEPIRARPSAPRQAEPMRKATGPILTDKTCLMPVETSPAATSSPRRAASASSPSRQLILVAHVSRSAVDGHARLAERCQDLGRRRGDQMGDARAAMIDAPEAVEMRDAQILGPRHAVQAIGHPGAASAARHLQRGEAGEAARPRLQPADIIGIGAALLVARAGQLPAASAILTSSPLNALPAGAKAPGVPAGTRIRQRRYNCPPGPDRAPEFSQVTTEAAVCASAGRIETIAVAPTAPSISARRLVVPFGGSFCVSSLMACPLSSWSFHIRKSLASKAGEVDDE